MRCFAIEVPEDKKLSEKCERYAEHYVEMACKPVMGKWGSRGAFQPDAAFRRLPAVELLGARRTRRHRPGNLRDAPLGGCAPDQRPPGFDRRHVQRGATRFDFPFSECAELNMAAALPTQVRAGELCMLACNVLVQGDVQIAVRQAEGNRDPEVLDRGSRRYQHFVPWKPRRPGRYIVRWTFNGSSYREAPVRVTA